MLAAILVPVIAVSFLPEHIGDQVAKFSLMGAGIAMQQTVDRPDNIQIGPGAGMLAVAGYAAVAAAVALWTIGRRDA